LTRAQVVLAILVCQFSEYCDKQFEIELVEIEHVDGTVTETPVLERNRFEVDFQVLNRALGMTLSKESIEKSLHKMGYTIESIEDTKAVVITPPIRTDVLHPCDIAEDIGIAFGYNNIKPQIPPTLTVGKPQPLNRFTDLLRFEIA
jgi:phenylalanyl-tRNA synthetase beta chain